MGPVEKVEIFQQTLGILGDLQDPLSKWPSFNRVASLFSLSILHLFIGKDRSQLGAVVDQDLRLVGKPLFIELGEDPLSPFIVVGVARRKLPLPIVAKAQRLELSPVGIDILFSGDFGVGPRADRILLGLEAKAIPSHRVENVEPLLPLVTRENVGCRIPRDVAHMEPRPRRIGKHIQDVVLRLRGVNLRFKQLLFFPVALPFLLNLFVVVLHGILIHLNFRFISLNLRGL
ncbi:hypothetical protein NEPTK9_001630 [Candidatus Neptunochlamydia vexilliferae]|uniref:Uncharacterized protein n=1 Tax=Candidatus Neptunichlamydia vexilliferae TaxID=1651774 RepID=A0ABS0B150_9BACT|nr:hypothetical protein [Candidatus Neptunochlamydia vexilliferae]